MADLWMEAWTLPELGSFAKATDKKIVGVCKVRDTHSGIGRGQLDIPADWPGLTELLSATGATLLRVMRRDENDAPQVVFEWYPEQTTKPLEERPTVTIPGPSIEAVLDRTVLLPYDWPDNPTVDPDWVYGGDGNLLTNASFDEGVTSWTFETQTDEGWVEYTGADIDGLDSGPDPTTDEANGGSWSLEFDPDQAYSGVSKTVTVAGGGRIQLQGFLKSNTSSKRFIMFAEVEDGFTDHSTNSDVVNGRIEVELDGAAVGAGATDGTWQQFDIDVTIPYGQNSLTFGVLYDDTGDGPVAYIDDITIAGYGAGLSPWIPVTPPGVTALATFEVGTHPDTSSDALLWKAPATTDAVYGVRQVVTNVQQGRTITFTGTIYHAAGANRDFDIILKRQRGSLGGSWLASQSKTVATATTTTFEITAVADAPEFWLDIRKGDTTTPVDVYVDDVQFFYGLPVATAGEIWGDLLTDAQTAHAAESSPYNLASLTWLKKDFSDTVDSNGDSWDEDLSLRFRRLQTYGQVMDQFTRLGYEYRIVPNPDWPDTDSESHLLQVFNPWDASAYTGGVGTDRTDTVKLTSGQAILTGPVSRSALSRTVSVAEDINGNLAVSKDATGITNWGQRQSGSIERNAFDAATLGVIAAQALTDRALTEASQIVMYENQFRPYLEFEPGDTVTFGLEPDLSDGSHRVATLSYEVGDTEPVWTVDFGRSVFHGLSGTVQAVNQLLRRSAEPDDTQILPSFTSTDFKGPIEVSYLVASSQERPAVRALADYVCDGTADEVEIGLAITAATTLTSGGRVVLGSGKFWTSDEASITVPSDVTLAGTGEHSTWIVPEGDLDITISGGWHDIRVEGIGC